MLICLNSTDYVLAQWTKKDSVWLQNALSGKEKLKLNEETMKAIQSGSLINFGEPASHMQMAPTNKLPVLKDFSEYIHPDSTQRKIALKDLPPSVFWLYAPKPEKILPVFQSILDEVKRNPIVAPGGIFFDLGKMTSRKEYVHKRNAKRDGTWKNYNNLPTPDIIKKKKEYAKANPALAGQDTLLLRKDSLQIIDTTKQVIPVPVN